jgi:diacylglycerol O-acyltransferase / wax synthase
VRQLTSLDAQFLALETPRTYGHVGGLAIYDPSTAPGGKVTIEDFCRLVSERLPLLPPFTWRLAEVPFGLDHPYWIEDPDFDLDFHVRETAVPPPGEDRQIAETVSRIFARPLDRSRPLWAAYLIHGIHGDRIGMLTKVHHAAVDGVSGAEILSVLLDVSPEGRPAPDVERAKPERAPSQLEMLGRGLAGVPRWPIRAVQSIPSTVPNIPNFPGLGAIPGVPTIERVLRRGSDGGVLEQRATRAPKLSFNGRISSHRRFSFGSLPLESVKRIKDELGIKVNDVVVALCATALREWLIERDELPREPLVALIPVSVRSKEEQGAFGNRVSGMVLPIPTDVADPRERLMRAHDILKLGKERHSGLPASLMTDASNFLPPMLFTRASRVATEVTGRLRPPLNVVISNVPGPPIPLYCAGATLEANYPVSVILDGVGLNITVLSYRDHLDFGIIADRDSVDDVWSLFDCLKTSLEELEEVICGPAEVRA